MKIEASKNHPVDKKESKNVFKTETSVFNASDPLKNAVPAPATSQSAFAKILEETRRENDKENAAASKTDSAERDSKAEKSEQDEKIENRLDEKLEERNSKNGDGDAQQNPDDNQSPAAALAALQSPVSSKSPAAAPAARSILHVADLERIVATIRTETFQNQKQITIALKNSVLQGLQIKLSIGENGKLKAEFLATGKQIKSQLERRKKELSEILHNRSTLFSEIEITSQE